MNPTPSVSVSRSVSSVTGLYPTGDCPSSAAQSVTGLCPIRDCPSSTTRGVTGLYPHGDCPSSAAAGYGMRLPGPGLEYTSIPPPTSAMSDLFGSFMNYFVSHNPAFASSLAHASNTQGGSIPSALGAPPSDTRSTPPPPPLHFSWGRGAFAFGLHSLPLLLCAVGACGFAGPGHTLFRVRSSGLSPGASLHSRGGFSAPVRDSLIAACVDVFRTFTVFRASLFSVFRGF